MRRKQASAERFGGVMLFDSRRTAYLYGAPVICLKKARV
jgi:hypothetical protein